MNILKETLDRFYREYDFSERLKHDPIEFPRRYANEADIEIAGFIASGFAYGRIDQFKPVIEKILAPGGERPASFISDLSLKRDAQKFRGINYRFNKEKDVLCLMYILSKTLRQWGSLKNLFYSCYKSDQHDIRGALDCFMEHFISIDTTPVYNKNVKPYGLKQLLPSPSGGSACKRMNLFLRWMVRNRDIDLGIWNKIPPSKLIVPLDTHISKIARCLGLTDRRASGWKTAKDITESLKKLDPDDPLKYDFALCHHGISGSCRGRRAAAVCSGCAFFLEARERVRL